MATTNNKKTNNKSKATTTKTNTTTAKAESKVVIDTPVVKDTPKAETKKGFTPTDGVICVSLVPGELGMIGLKSGQNYTWNGRGDEVEVEYQDLVAAIRMNKKHIKEPYFIIKDKDFLREFPDVDKIYASMYAISDLKDVLSLDVSRMKSVIISLPNGAKESLKSVASSMISNGTLDSIKKIQALDEIFNTNFMLMTELYK